ncbi:hypothetical protein TGPRC2_363720 [Toxoplasma gondii TgCatPRC2]|uniref:Uncharacterized protein n=1 Tax=Toxoplasma gondii TgCatPRC2 TaxID=1130821 RepID=A0A151H7L7_TOXGO|nr:hypothetical protein TGPRC2_363720 [Toxoplasma gondii TgCatPRC2]
MQRLIFAANIPTSVARAIRARSLDSARWSSLHYSKLHLERSETMRFGSAHREGRILQNIRDYRSPEMKAGLRWHNEHDDPTVHSCVHSSVSTLLLQQWFGTRHSSILPGASGTKIVADVLTYEHTTKRWPSS